MDVSIVVAFDNSTLRPDLVPGWGFSCVVRFSGRTILFDTGSDSTLLLHNMDRLGIGPERVDAVVLSHAHADHANGLGGFLERKADVTVYMPRSFPKRYKEGVRELGAEVREIHEPGELFDNVLTTGERGSILKEQAMVLEASKGTVVVTGCAHPGIVNILQWAKELTGQQIALALGGFHFPKRSVLDGFKQLEVRAVAPCHCSGDEARRFFREAYGSQYFDIGVGKEIEIPG